MEDVDTYELVFPLFLYPFGFSVIDRITTAEEGRPSTPPLPPPCFRSGFFLLVNSPLTRYAIQLCIFVFSYTMDTKMCV